jgi:apolipoprotein N-acyltransferase
MKTPYDWITVLIFAGLVTRFLQRSTSQHVEDVSLSHYLVAAIGCGIVNWLGNEGRDMLAVAALALVLTYTAYFIFEVRRGRTPH